MMRGQSAKSPDLTEQTFLPQIKRLLLMECVNKQVHDTSVPKLFTNLC